LVKVEPASGPGGNRRRADPLLVLTRCSRDAPQGLEWDDWDAVGDFEEDEDEEAQADVEYYWCPLPRAPELPAEHVPVLAVALKVLIKVSRCWLPSCSRFCDAPRGACRREWLERLMDSLAVNAIVILLVLVDITNIVISLVSPEADPLAEHPVQRWLSFGVISCFVLEMALRMLAMGRRFFRSWYNIFDVVVVSVSVAARAPAPDLSPPLPTVAPTRVATVHSRPSPHTNIRCRCRAISLSLSNTNTRARTQFHTHAQKRDAKTPRAPQVLCVRLALEAMQSISGDQSSALTSIGVLRVVSRVAVVLRVLRVLIKLRRARKLSGRFAEKLRTKVSQNKRRYVKHGFDLDLTSPP
jgi:hypothetical protein